MRLKVQAQVGHRRPHATQQLQVAVQQRVGSLQVRLRLRLLPQRQAPGGGAEVEAGQGAALHRARGRADSPGQIALQSSFRWPKHKHFRGG